MTTPLERLIRSLDVFPDVVDDAKRKAAIEAAFFLRDEVQDYIVSGGKGTWADKTDLAKRLTKFNRGARKGQWKRASSAQRRQQPLRRFAGLPRFILRNGGENVTVGFSTRKRPRRFSNRLEKTISDVQKNRTFTVDRKTRKALAASKTAIAKTKRKKAVPGKDFFVAKEGATINIPGRPIIDPVAQQQLPFAVEKYNDRLEKELERERIRRNLAFDKFK